MAEPVKPVETIETDLIHANNRIATETLSLSLDLLSQNAGSLAMARQMRSLAQLSESQVKTG